MSKELLVQNIKDWIKLENDISKLNLDLKEKKEKKKQLTVNLVKTMKDNSIECFDINGGSLIYKSRKQKKAITGKTLLTTLQNYYKSDEKMAEELTKYIMENREIVIKETIELKK